MIWHAQAGQDEWVYSVIGDGGFFVDVGAHDGITNSNTYALEMYHGWSGICIEPDSAVFPLLQRNRPDAALADVAIASEEGIAKILPSQERRAALPLRDLLDRFTVPLVIDYLSVDTEGYDLEVLQSMDFERWHVRTITVEHNAYFSGTARQNAIKTFLEANDFKRVRWDVIAEGYGPYEDWYLSNRWQTHVEA